MDAGAAPVGGPAPGQGGDNVTDDLRETLWRLERALASADPSGVDGGLEGLIADGFLEFGASGRTWDKASMRQTLAGATPTPPVDLEDFAVEVARGRRRARDLPAGAAAAVEPLLDLGAAGWPLAGPLPPGDAGSRVDPGSRETEPGARQGRAAAASVSSTRIRTIREIRSSGSGSPAGNWSVPRPFTCGATSAPSSSMTTWLAGNRL